MRLKKGMTLIAVGFLFITFYIRIILKGSVLTLPPQFVGWILLVLAYPKIVKYTSYSVSLYWIPLVLAVYSALDWVLGLLNLALALPLLTAAAGILVIVYLVKLLGCLEFLARDYARNLVPRVHTLKVLYLSLMITMNVFSFLLVTLPLVGGFPALALISILLWIAGLAAAVVSIVICVTLFQRRKAIPAVDPAIAEIASGGDGFGATGT